MCINILKLNLISFFQIRYSPNVFTNGNTPWGTYMAPGCEPMVSALCFQSEKKTFSCRKILILPFDFVLFSGRLWWSSSTTSAPSTPSSTGPGWSSSLKSSLYWGAPPRRKSWLLWRRSWQNWRRPWRNLRPSAKSWRRGRSAWSKRRMTSLCSCRR